MSGKPAARIGDNHVCPEVTVIVPHVGGPIVEGSENVFINGKPAARVGDMATCVGPTDHIATGSPTVFINGKPAARMGDMTEHGGVIIGGSGNVFIGDSSSSAGGGAGGAKVTVNSEQLNMASQFQETAAPEEKESLMAAIKEYIRRVVRGEILSENLARYEKLLTDAMAGDPEASREMIEAFAGFGGVGKITNSAKIVLSIKGKLKAVQLPITGKIRFIPKKGYNPNNPLPKGPNGGYIDRFGNEWVKGPSRTKGQTFEWDVQLSKTGKKKLGWLTRDGSHANVSTDGKITHR